MALRIRSQARHSRPRVQPSRRRLWATIGKLLKNRSAQIGRHRECFWLSRYLQGFGGPKKDQSSGNHMILIAYNLCRIGCKKIERWMKWWNQIWSLLYKGHFSSRDWSQIIMIMIWDKISAISRFKDIDTLRLLTDIEGLSNFDEFIFLIFGNKIYSENFKTFSLWRKEDLLFWFGKLMRIFIEIFWKF